MTGAPMDPAYSEDHAGAIKNPEFRIRTEQEPENGFSRWYLYYIVKRGAGASQKAAEGRILASNSKHSYPPFYGYQYSQTMGCH